MPFTKEMEDVFYFGIQQPVRSAGLLCERIDQDAFIGDILDQVKGKIETAAVVIADLSGANPNVYLEVGYAWGKGRPTLLLANSEQELRFDVRGQRCLKYESIKNLADILSRELRELQDKKIIGNNQGRESSLVIKGDIMMVRIQPYETKTLLVTVKTYPTPSTKYIETTCVSGITDNNNWIRLHPVNFRSLEEANQFPRYSRIRVRVNKATRDSRPESYHLDIDSIEHLGVVPTTNAWQERRAIIEPMLSRSIEDLQDQQKAHKTSLGVIRPKEIIRFRMEEVERNWSPEQLAKLDQQDLFSPGREPRLEKIPFRFVYEFNCDDPRCKGHKMQVFDWEVAQAYRRWRRGKTRSEWEQMFRKEFDYNVRHTYDSLFFLGTLAAHPETWIIGGIFFAPKKRPLLQEAQPAQPTLWQAKEGNT